MFSISGIVNKSISLNGLRVHRAVFFRSTNALERKYHFDEMLVTWCTRIFKMTIGHCIRRLTMNCWRRLVAYRFHSEWEHPMQNLAWKVSAQGDTSKQSLVDQIWISNIKIALYQTPPHSTWPISPMFLSVILSNVNTRSDAGFLKVPWHIWRHLIYKSDMESLITK